MERLFLLINQDGSQRQETLKKIRSKFLDKTNFEFNYHTFYPKETNLKEVLQQGATAGFLSKHRVVALRDVNRLNLKQKEILREFIKRQPKSCVLILDAAILPPSDIIYKTVNSSGRIVNLGTTQARRRGQAFGADTFRLADAVGLKKCSLALYLLNRLSQEAIEPSEIVGVLGWHLRRMWKAKRLINKGVDKSQVARTIGIPQFFMDSFFRQVGQFLMEDIETAISQLLKIDVATKTRKVSPFQELEQFIIRLSSTSLARA